MKKYHCVNIPISLWNEINEKADVLKPTQMVIQYIKEGLRGTKPAKKIEKIKKIINNKLYLCTYSDGEGDIKFEWISEKREVDHWMNVFSKVEASRPEMKGYSQSCLLPEDDEPRDMDVLNHYAEELYYAWQHWCAEQRDTDYEEMRRKTL